jgi:hypothetical protein
MATRCIDISENRKLGTVSPLAIFAFVGIYIILTAFMEPGFTYILLLVISYILTQIFFQYTPRFIFLLLKFLLTNARLSPSFQDEKYIGDHKQIKSLQTILPMENSSGRYGSDYN